MAAEVAAEAGHRVRVFDHRRSPARKFVLAGRGGLNITHGEPLDRLLDRYGLDRERLEPAIRAFTPDDLRAWCARLGHDTFIGSSGRVFPVEMRAVPLLRSWLDRLRVLGVDLRPQHRWTGWDEQDMLRFESPAGVVASAADAVVLALGGASWPQVGSDGSWVDVLAARGIAVNPLRASNCGVTIGWSSHVADRLAGTPLKNVAIVVDGIAARGDPIITTTGLEGGPVYAHGRRLRDRLADGQTRVDIDLFPDIDVGALVARIRRSRRPSDSVSSRLRRAGFSPAAASLVREVTGNAVPDDDEALASLAKAVPLEIDGLAPIDRAISSAGGVAWSELDEHFELRRRPGTFAVGEMLDWDAPTGGYLLQACLSTARLAAASIGPARSD